MMQEPGNEDWDSDQRVQTCTSIKFNGKRTIVDVISFVGYSKKQCNSRTQDLLTIRRVNGQRHGQVDTSLRLNVPVPLGDFMQGKGVREI